MPHVHAIYRYPIKGLGPQALHGAALAPGQTIPGDRLYAIENGPSGFDPVKRRYLSKQHFLMLMKNERLAGLRTSFDDKTHTLTITIPSPLVGEGQGGGSRADARALMAAHDYASASLNVGALPHDPHPSPSAQGGGKNPQGGREISADLRSAAGRARIENFFAQYCADELRGPPRILHAEGHSFSDVARKVVSIVNLASVAAVEDMVGAPVDPLRFRGNVYVEGWPAWSELDLVGKELAVGANARLKIVKRIVRCAATNVDPATGIRDLEIPKALMRHLGHGDCGIYAEVIAGGDIAAGDAIEIG